MSTIAWALIASTTGRPAQQGSDMTDTSTHRKAAARVRVQRYRKAHPIRLDYVPGPAARRVIAAWVNGGKLDPTIAGTLDALVLAGDAALRATGRERVSGNEP